MSSFEAKTYTAKPPVTNSITVTKPIIQSNLQIKKPQQHLLEQQHLMSQPPKRIQPLIKPAPNSGTTSVFHLKGFHKGAQPAANIAPDYSRIEVTKKKSVTTFETVAVKKQGSEGGVRRIRKEVKKSDIAMGNENTRMPHPGNSGAAQLTGGPSMGGIVTEPPSSSSGPQASNIHTGHPHNNNIPLPVAQFNSNSSGASSNQQSASSVPSSVITATVNPRMASIINPAEAKQGELRTGSPNSAPQNLSAGPRVVSTSSSKTITGGIPVTGATSKNSSQHKVSSQTHKHAAQLGARTAVIQSPANLRAAPPQQQPIVRPRSMPIAAGHPRPLTPQTLHQSGTPTNPTTVQITIHQPKQTTSSAGSMIHNTHLHSGSPHAAPHSFSSPSLSSSSHGPHHHGSHGGTPTQPAVLQKLVISQTPSGQIQQNRTTIPMPFNHEANRIITSSSAAHSSAVSMKKPLRPVVTSGGGLIPSSMAGSGQHDYIRSDSALAALNTRKFPTDSSTANRPSVSIHTLPDSQRSSINTGPYSNLVPPHPSSSPSMSTSPSVHPVTNSYIPSTVQGLEAIHNPAPGAQNNPNVYKHTYNMPPTAHNSSGMPTIITNQNKPVPMPSNAPPASIPTVVMGDNSSSATSQSQTDSHSGSPRPSILRKRGHDSSGNPIVVNKLLQQQQSGDRLSAHASSSPASPGRHHHHLNSHLPPDNTSQSSTDTAMSSESPNQTLAAIKQEVVDPAENGAADLSQPDVSPRKKPRKQLLNTAAQLKDRHDSSTEEETETKHSVLSAARASRDAAASSRVSDLPTTIPEPYKMEFDLDNKSASIKEEFVDREGVRWVKMRQRHADPMLCFYNCTWKSRNNHFQRHSDIKVKEERRPVVSELSNQKGVQQKASGWKFYHISAQFQEMIETEQTLQERMDKLQQQLSNRLKNNPELCKIHEIAQANKQRCSLTKDQLQEAKASMFSILDTHKPKIMEIIQKNHSKRPVKKKERS